MFKFVVGEFKAMWRFILGCLFLFWKFVRTLLIRKTFPRCETITYDRAYHALYGPEKVAASLAWMTTNGRGVHHSLIKCRSSEVYNCHMSLIILEIKEKPSFRIRYIQAVFSSNALIPRVCAFLTICRFYQLNSPPQRLLGTPEVFIFFLAANQTNVKHSIP